jgi:hypothetical protein
MFISRREHTYLSSLKASTFLFLPKTFRFPCTKHSTSNTDIIRFSAYEPNKVSQGILKSLDSVYCELILYIFDSFIITQWRFGGVVNAMPCYYPQWAISVGISFGSKSSNLLGVDLFAPFLFYSKHAEWTPVCPRPGGTQ